MSDAPYCYMHGYRVARNHTSRNCRSQKQGHQTGATATNTLGGNTRGFVPGLIQQPQSFQPSGSGRMQTSNVSQMNGSEYTPTRTHANYMQHNTEHSMEMHDENVE